MWNNWVERTLFCTHSLDLPIVFSKVAIATCTLAPSVADAELMQVVDNYIGANFSRIVGTMVDHTHFIATTPTSQQKKFNDVICFDVQNMLSVQ